MRCVCCTDECVECSECLPLQGRILTVCEGASGREYTKHRIAVQIQLIAITKVKHLSNRHNT